VRVQLRLRGGPARWAGDLEGRTCCALADPWACGALVGGARSPGARKRARGARAQERYAGRGAAYRSVERGCGWDSTRGAMPFFSRPAL
jgi:hypothetical protein